MRFLDGTSITFSQDFSSEHRDTQAFPAAISLGKLKIYLRTPFWIERRIEHFIARKTGASTIYCDLRSPSFGLITDTPEGGGAWHRDVDSFNSYLDYIAVWTNVHPTLVRDSVTGGNLAFEPYDVVLIDNRRAVHRCPDIAWRGGVGRWFARCSFPAGELENWYTAHAAQLAGKSKP